MQGKKVLLCVPGGIAAFKVVQVARDLTEQGADVRVLMTRSAERFVGAQTFAALTGNPVASQLFGGGADVPHVELARGASLAVVAPATANTISRLAAGAADDLVTATLLTVRCPILVVPAMHTEMWEHPATQQNLATLKSRGVRVLGPAAGALSSGDSGPGRMVEPTEISAAATGLLGRSEDLAGVRVLITAGGTREPIDPVRYIGNNSSGRMGYILAEAAVARGAKVSLVSGPSSLAPPHGIDLVRVTTAAEMREAVLARAADADVVIKAAAVADFTPVEVAPRKIKKDEGPPGLTLVPTKDILAELGHDPALRKQGGVLVGFAAETEGDPSKLMELAELKRAAKGADVVVANQVGVAESGFDASTSRAVMALPGEQRDLGLVAKEDLAAMLLTLVRSLLSQQR